MEDYILGKKSLEYYYNRARQLNSSLPPTYEAFLTQMAKTYLVSLGYTKTQPDQWLNTSLDGLGFGIRSSGLSDSRVKAAFERLATRLSGKLPSRFNDFFNALIDESRQISTIDMLKEVSKGVVSDIASGAQATREGIIATYNMMGWGKYVLFGAVAAGVTLAIRSFGSKVGKGVELAGRGIGAGAREAGRGAADALRSKARL